jgi:elongation factor 2
MLSLLITRSIASLYLICRLFCLFVCLSIISHAQTGWGFSLTDFAKLHHERFGLSVVKMTKKLWGDNYFCPIANKWQSTPISITTGKRLPRAFCSLVLQPIRQMFESILAGDEMKVNKFLAKLNIKLPPKTFETPIINNDGSATSTATTTTSSSTTSTPGTSAGTTSEGSSTSSSSSSSSSIAFEAGKTRVGKERLRVVMGCWLPAADALLTLIVQHLPSPIEAMKYRTAHLYTGPQDDDIAMAMRNCAIGPIHNSAGVEPTPLMIYVSKMVPTADHKRFIAIARIYSGRLRPGMSSFFLFESTHTKHDLIIPTHCYQ